jgi:3-dehydroquinate synthase
MHQVLSFNFSQLPCEKALFVIDSKVYGLYRKEFEAIDKEKLFIIDEIDGAKSWDHTLKIVHFFYEKNMKRQDEVYAIGGGTLTDLVGFAASIFKRGLNLILVPTTLLGMVDASIGGKNGINYQGVKNLIGTFYPPKKVLVNALFLESLSNKDYLSGFAEALKLGLICSKQLWTELSISKITDDLIKKCIEEKLKIVTLDPLDNGVRHILNFGHTIGHAYEACSKLEHGYCVALGILAESFISHVFGNLSYKDYLEIKETIKSLYGTFPKFPFKDMVSFLEKDKKNQDHMMKVHFLEKIGQFPKLQDVSLDILEKGYDSVWT